MIATRPMDESLPPLSHDPADADAPPFRPLWFLASTFICAVLTTAVVVGLPLMIRSLDFEGYKGMLVVLPVWFVSGLLVGLISPGKAYAESVFGTLVVAAPTVFLLVRYQLVYSMPVFVYLLLAAVGLSFALIGSYCGERWQLEHEKHAQ